VTKARYLPSFPYFLFSSKTAEPTYLASNDKAAFLVGPQGQSYFSKSTKGLQKSALSDKAHTTVLHATGTGLNSSQVKVLGCLTTKVEIQGRMITSLKSLRYPLMKMILLLKLPLLLVSPHSPPDISQIPPSSMGETIVAIL
jgi:hypothetical protein